MSCDAKVANASFSVGRQIPATQKTHLSLSVHFRVIIKILNSLIITYLYMFNARPVLTLRVVMLKHCIHHFHIDNIAPCLAPQFCLMFIFDFSWDDCNTKKKLETMLMQFFFGGRWGGE